jgi:hypothetical protein
MDSGSSTPFLQSWLKCHDGPYLFEVDTVECSSGLTLTRADSNLGAPFRQVRIINVRQNFTFSAIA